VFWLWTGTAEIPEKEEKHIGGGLSLPLYSSGPTSAGWWAMFITMVGDSTAFASLVFGYFFYWTIHEDFTAGLAGPGMQWPSIAIALFAAAWALTLASRELNARGMVATMRVALIAGFALTLAATMAGLAGPWRYSMDPTAHVYPAIVWLLALWVAVHAAVGGVMQLYCFARSLARRLTPRHDMDIHNVALYWHFLVVTAVITFVVVGFFPEAM
jgi:cytochrome c oxidase subunit I+III